MSTPHQPQNNPSFNQPGSAPQQGSDAGQQGNFPPQQGVNPGQPNGGQFQPAFAPNQFSPAPASGPRQTIKLTNQQSFAIAALATAVILWILRALTWAKIADSDYAFMLAGSGKISYTSTDPDFRLAVSGTKISFAFPILGIYSNFFLILILISAGFSFLKPYLRFSVMTAFGSLIGYALAPFISIGAIVAILANYDDSSSTSSTSSSAGSSYGSGTGSSLGSPEISNDPSFSLGAGLIITWIILAILIGLFIWGIINYRKLKAQGATEFPLQKLLGLPEQGANAQANGFAPGNAQSWNQPQASAQQPGQWNQPAGQSTPQQQGAPAWNQPTPSGAATPEWNQTGGQNSVQPQGTPSWNQPSEQSTSQPENKDNSSIPSTPSADGSHTGLIGEKPTETSTDSQNSEENKDSEAKKNRWIQD